MKQNEVACNEVSSTDLLGEDYWCVYCGRCLKPVDGVITHDEKPHPENITFDEERNPQ